MNLFLQKRITRFIEDFRVRTGQLPTLKDFETANFNRADVEAAIKLNLIEQFYVTLSNGTIVKGFKVRQ